MKPKKIHLKSFGVRSYCGQILMPEEMTPEKFFCAERKYRCAACTMALIRRGYSIAVLEKRFSFAAAIEALKLPAFS